MIPKIPSQNKFNLNFGYSTDLLEVPEDPQSVSDYCDKCVQWINAEMEKNENDWDIKTLVTVLGQVAAYMKMIRDLDSALEFIKTALSLIEQYDFGIKQFVAQSLRWADILRYRGELAESEEIFISILEMCDQESEVKVYKDVALQHLGKLYFDLGEYAEAMNYFEKALAIRKIKKEQSLIDSTVLAIEATLLKIEESLRS